MKKLTFFAVAGAALLLASCSQDSLVNEVHVDKTSNGPVPMEFNYHVGNQTRGANMETMFYQFGVYAYKANAQADIDVATAGGKVVMDDYMVGYWDGANEGYNPTLSQNLYGTTWYYEGLGNGQTHYTFISTAEKVEVASRKENQFLKYWDLGSTYTYFYAFAPYTSFVTMSLEGDKTYMKFQTSLTPESDPCMYAIARCENSDYVLNKKKVDLVFKQLLSQVRLAFYETIPGYTVELIDYKLDDYPNVLVLPSKLETGAYSASDFVTGGKPKVEFVENAATAVTYEDQTTTSGALVYALADFKDKTNAATTVLGGNYGDRIFSATKNMMPQAATGFTLNVSLKLTAEDTQEVTTIHGIRVFVASDYTNWQANKLYTYVFHITRKVPGTTGPDPDPNPEPDPDPALWPIIFDQVTVDDFTEALDNKEWDVNPQGDADTNPMTPGHGE